MGLTINAQRYYGYSDEKINLESEYLQDKIELSLHLPETWASASDSVQYPLYIIFDSQHEYIYPQIISSFDLLTNESQIHEAVIVGVPFTIQNRKYLTSNRTLEGDSLSGIKKTENFLFNELIPLLEEKYKINAYLGLIGHSRTGFLVNYLVSNRTKEINLAAALSGFYNNDPLSTGSFLKHVCNPDNFKNKLRYYYSAGTTNEEVSYYRQYVNFNKLHSKQRPHPLFEAKFIEIQDANHMTNYWVSVPPILIEANQDYNKILNDWMDEAYVKTKSHDPLNSFKADLKNEEESIGHKLYPSLTHIFSIASTYAYQFKDFVNAIAFLEYGSEYFPHYYDLDYQILAWQKETGDNSNYEKRLQYLKSKIENNKNINQKEKEELLNQLKD